MTTHNNQSPHTTIDGKTPVLYARGMSKKFGAVRALSQVDIELLSHTSVGIVGHNGAGKSTLMNVLCGTLKPDEGELFLSGKKITSRWDVREAQRLGVRCVFQELSLCQNLTLAENMHLSHPSKSGLRWRQHAGDALVATLDLIFPGHGLHPDKVVADLPIGQRQVVEIARGFTPGNDPLDLMILDEPTSSLDNVASDHLMAYIRKFTGEGKTCVLITHKMREIFEVTDDLIVMRDGTVADTFVTRNTDREQLVASMGQHENAPASTKTNHREPAKFSTEVVVQAKANAKDTIELKVQRGEIVGFAGLAGHGQTELLTLLRAAGDGHITGQVKATIPAAFVAGDRQNDGVFNLWSIARNMTVSSLDSLRKYGLINPEQESDRVQQWRKKLGLVTSDVNLPILSLSGGNQQKVLFARALASPAPLILMDDPMRGVDIGTKMEVYELIASEARNGRSFIWYTTEFDELFYCDRVYVFYDQHIVGVLNKSELSEERVLSLSFQEVV
jgi:ribose transport system ATP-binding protein